MLHSPWPPLLHLLPRPGALLRLLSIRLFSHLQVSVFTIPSTWNVSPTPKSCLFGRLLFILKNPTWTSPLPESSWAASRLYQDLILKVFFIWTASYTTSHYALFQSSPICEYHEGRDDAVFIWVPLALSTVPDAL